MELIERAYGLSIFDLHVKSILQGTLPDFDLARRLADRAAISRQGHRVRRTEMAQRLTRAVGRRAIFVMCLFRARICLPGGPYVHRIWPLDLTQAECFAGLVAQAETIKGEIYAR